MNKPRGGGGSMPTDLAINVAGNVRPNSCNPNTIL